MKQVLAEDSCSSSYYRYGKEYDELADEIHSQDDFVNVRLRYVEPIIRILQRVDYRFRDDDRLRACLKARTWCEKMIKERRR